MSIFCQKGCSWIFEYFFLYTGNVHLANFRKKLLKQRRFRQALAAAVLLAIVMGIVIVPIERVSPLATIKNTSDGLWWSVQTLTTIGYGDVVPVTGVGRLLGVAVQILGAVLFGVLIAMIGSSMNRSQEEFYWSRLFQRIDDLEEKIKYLEKSQNVLVQDVMIETDDRDKAEAQNFAQAFKQSAGQK